MMQSKSQLSTTYDNLDNNLMQCLEKIKEQNEYLKKALDTAENLIKNYQEENNKLVMEVKIMNCKLRQADHKYYELIKNNEKDELKRLTENLLTKKVQQEKQSKIQQLNEQIRVLIKTIENYQLKINEMEYKVALLQKNNNENFFLKRQVINLNIDLQKNITLNSVQSQCGRKAKNLEQLKAFHLKLTNKDIQIQKTEKQKSKKRIVQTVFSKQKLRDSGSTKTIISQKTQNSFQKKRK